MKQKTSKDRKEYMKEWKKNNKARLKEYDALYHARNRDKILERKKQANIIKKSSGEKKEYDALYYARNRDKILELKKQANNKIREETYQARIKQQSNEPKKKKAKVDDSLSKNQFQEPSLPLNVQYISINLQMFNGKNVQVSCNPSLFPNMFNQDSRQPLSSSIHPINYHVNNEYILGNHYHLGSNENDYTFTNQYFLGENENQPMTNHLVERNQNQDILYQSQLNKTSPSLTGRFGLFSQEANHPKSTETNVNPLKRRRFNDF